MDEPDWYAAWRHEAFHELQEKNALLKAKFELSAWSRYDYDLTTGTLTFSDDHTVRVIADIQVAGSTSMAGGDWMWAWANTHWPVELVTDSRRVKEFGEEHGICELTHEHVEDGDLNNLGWQMTAVMARITGGVGAYRPPRDEGGGLFLMYKELRWTL